MSLKRNRNRKGKGERKLEEREGNPAQTSRQPVLQPKLRNRPSSPPFYRSAQLTPCAACVARSSLAPPSSRSARAPLTDRTGPHVSPRQPLVARVARCLRSVSDPSGPHVGAAPPAAAPASLSLPSWPHPLGRRLAHAARPSLLARARVSDPPLSFLLTRVRPSSPPRISPHLRPPRNGRLDPARLL